MIRRSLILWVALAALVSVALFVVKYEVKSLEEEYARLNREILRTREAIHVLRAEWSYLNRPDQLAEMAQRHLDLHPLLAPQMGELNAVPQRKPEPGIAEAARPAGDAPAKSAVPIPVAAKVRLTPSPAPTPTPAPKMTPVLTSTKEAP